MFLYLNFPNNNYLPKPLLNYINSSIIITLPYQAASASMTAPHVTMVGDL